MINYIYQLVAPKTFSIKYKDIDFGKNVIVKPRYMSVCHADQRYYTGQRNQKVLKKKLPMALIHECCGEVIYDPSGTYLTGTPVVLIPNVPGKPDDIILENYTRDAGFLSSGIDGFMREYIELPVNRIVSSSDIPYKIAAVTEFVSVAVHSVQRFLASAHSRRDTIGIWGDGSLAFVVANIVRMSLPKAKIVVVGRNIGKLSYFSFVDETYLTEEIPNSLKIDHAFECCGGEGSYYAIEDIIRYINPQGTIMLMGVSENYVDINTRDVLEKGLMLLGSSRSGRSDFKQAVIYMKDRKFQRRLELILYETEKVKSISDIHRVFQEDINTPFKTVFEWGL